jgi:hypothetical protein
MAAAVAFLPYIMTAASTVMSMSAKKQQGEQAQASANYQANQLDQSAGQQFASAQRASLSDQQQARMAQSRALAVAAASGGGASDPTVMSIMSRLAGEGTYRGMVDLYQGREKARQLEDQANALRFQGDIASSNSKYSSAATLVSGASSMYSKYAADHRPSAMGGDSGASGFGSSDSGSSNYVQNTLF